MNLSTAVQIAPSSWHIGYQDKILLLGSCFADSIGAKMCECYFQVVTNPFGTLYNPLSIAQALQLHAVPTLVAWGGMWHSMYHHGSFSSVSKEEAEQHCFESIERLQHAVAEASVVVVTFGTSWVYEMRHAYKGAEGSVVANCHKMPAAWFTRRRLGVEDIVAQWEPLIKQYADKHLLFTVSPIRHLKDGLHANQVSKAILLEAVDSLVTIGKDANCSVDYFPAYEIMLDELRDYRYYAEDMLHPSSVAVDYIWERFADTYVTNSTREEMRELHQLWLDRHHTLLHPSSPESVAYQERLAARVQSFRQRYPWV